MALAAATANMVTSTASANAPAEQVITVPGFADFIAVDGDSVWLTNRTKVERWSRNGKLAEAPMTRSCGTMAVYRGSLWAADCKEAAVIRIDTRTATRTAVIPTGIANKAGELNVIVGAGSIWIASDDSGVVSRIDPRTNQIVAKVTVDPGTWYLAYGYGAVWAVSANKQSLQKIDPRSNTVVGRTALGNTPGFLAAGVGAVWVQEQGDGTLARIDPRTVTVEGRVKVGEALKWGDIDTGAGKVWLRTTEDQTFAVVDPKTMKVVASPEIDRQIETSRGRWAPAGAIRICRLA